ncbi:cuticle protein 7-like [Cherax quadricarinatus]|uniref:cuticle protein 7-like n=1 Tax=Cherax quadricarinatus TaxID=27406 RepID=UPI00387E93FD
MRFGKKCLITHDDNVHLEVPYFPTYKTHNRSIITVILTLSLVAATLAAPSLLPSYGYNPALSYRPLPAYQVPPKYNFGYSINDDFSGNNFGHQETRDGYDTKGSYSVQLPDGRIQLVTYTVSGDSGYLAEVKYIGEARYPAYQPTYKPVPAYRPAPVYI